MKYIITLITLTAIASIIYGFTLETTQKVLSNKYIGAGTATLFLVSMPLFLYKESKGKKMNDYMLTEENVRKMQGKEPKKSENQ
ncbi:hypothetical protein [uncultured Maribacter sp.]|uniref:hypothetical protein n=1 Tax=uncultured Maribacter sp. TaxID=431308 RepID=UPI002627FEE3|nr:hypothetical protein [uncultured Maribacter sp.]